MRCDVLGKILSTSSQKWHFPVYVMVNVLRYRKGIEKMHGLATYISNVIIWKIFSLRIYSVTN